MCLGLYLLLMPGTRLTLVETQQISHRMAKRWLPPFSGDSLAVKRETGKTREEMYMCQCCGSLGFSGEGHLLTPAPSSSMDGHTPRTIEDFVVLLLLRPEGKN